MGRARTIVKHVGEQFSAHGGQLSDHELRNRQLEEGTPGRTGTQSDFKPGCIEIKGYCAFESRRIQELKREGIQHFIANSTNTLPESLRSKVGPPAIKQLRSYKSRLDVDPEYAGELKQFCVEIKSGSKVLLHSRQQNAMLERHPRA